MCVSASPTHVKGAPGRRYVPALVPSPACLHLAHVSLYPSPLALILSCFFHLQLFPFVCFFLDFSGLAKIGELPPLSFLFPALALSLSVHVGGAVLIWLPFE